MEIQWYPGHMAKSMRRMEQDIKLCDIVIEITDARAPLTSSNENLKKLAGKRQILVLLNKSDLSDPQTTAGWIKYFEDGGKKAVRIDSRRRDSIGAVKQAVFQLCAEKRKRDLERGITGQRPVKAMVCGIPNVGKSTFINSMLGKASAKTGDTPGVTRGGQWLNINNEFLLLDTPGIHMPKFTSEEAGMKLALLGTINDDIVNSEELAMYAISFLYENYRGCLMERYSLTEEAVAETEEGIDLSVPGLNKKSLAILDLISKNRGCLKKRGEYDYQKSSRLIIEDYRSGRLGRISLEMPPRKTEA